jgi:hypothetical protein
MSLRATLRREGRVAFSRRAQPVWFRIIKWIVLLALIARYWRSGTFWMWIGLVLLAGIPVHLLWRYKTKNWTQPWRGWNDVDAGR